MDLKTLNLREQADDAKWMTLIHPITKKELDAQVEFYGVYSTAHRKAKIDLLEKVRAGEIETEYEQTCFILSRLIKSVKNLEYGGKVKHSADKYYDILIDLDWVVDQAREFTNSVDTFFLTAVKE